MIFTTKALITSVIGAIIGLVIYYFLSTILGLGKTGLIIIVVFAAIGYGIATLKMPESNNFEITRKTGGERLDDVLIRALKFKQKGKRIYVYTKEEGKKWVFQMF